MYIAPFGLSGLQVCLEQKIRVSLDKRVEFAMQIHNGGCVYNESHNESRARVDQRDGELLVRRECSVTDHDQDNESQTGWSRVYSQTKEQI